MSALEDALHGARVMGIIRARDASTAFLLADAAIGAGMTALEVSFTTAGAAQVITRIRQEHPTAVVGAGTITTPDSARAAADAGAQFMVSQGFSRPTIAAAQTLGIPFFPGVLTPTEIVTALEAGAEAVKLFPVGALPSSYIPALRGPFPDLEILAVGGLDLVGAEAALRAGASCVGVQSPLFGALDSEAVGSDAHLDAVRSRVTAYLSLAAQS